MGRKNSDSRNRFSLYARVCARSIFFQITLISILFFAPAFGASSFEFSVGELKSATTKMHDDGFKKIKPFWFRFSARGSKKE